LGYPDIEKPFKGRDTALRRGNRETRAVIDLKGDVRTKEQDLQIKLGRETR
jgi:hypothetical protein